MSGGAVEGDGAEAAVEAGVEEPPGGAMGEVERDHLSSRSWPGKSLGC